MDVAPPLPPVGAPPSLLLSDSTESSPTTTVSTVDDSSMTDSSPTSSPQSPASLGPLPSLTPKRARTLTLAPPPPSSSDPSSLNPPPSPFLGQIAPVSPGRKPRNTKNLSLNMAAPARPGPPPSLRIKTATAAHAFQSAPPSPTLVMPDRPPKKRPSKLGLTIQTPATGRFPGAMIDQVNVVPPTPSTIRPNILRHHQSSPSLSLFSPTTGLAGGMQLPPFPSQRGIGPLRGARQFHSRSQQSSFDSSSTISEEASPAISTSLADLDEDDDYSVPLSQEVKSPAYPSGPVCIYDPLVYLYLEPSDVEASRFDVVFNVAREVRNPFHAPSKGPSTDKSQVVSDLKDMDLKDRTAVDLVAPVPTPPPSDSEANAPPDSMMTDPTPSAEKPIDKEPEYIHVPWDHNSNIVDDLLRLVVVIDERVRQGKRVLVHCQCGVSRSASLIVAYGLYKEPSLTVQEVYDTVKKKSRWIGPNMSLIYQLSEFRTKMIKTRGLTLSNSRSWRSTGSIVSLGANARANTLPSDKASSQSRFAVDDFPADQSAPQTAPLPDERDRTSARPGSSHKDPCLEPVNTDRRVDVSAGPLSAPSGFSWNLGWPPSPRDSRSPRRSPSRSPSRSPLRKITVVPPPLALVRAPRKPTGDEGITVHTTEIDRPMEDVPPTPSLMSPRACMFTNNPLREPVMRSVFGFHAGISVDPRSPAQKGEAPIVRNIFDVL